LCGQIHFAGKKLRKDIAFQELKKWKKIMLIY
jgi:hypothetical protein